MRGWGRWLLVVVLLGAPMQSTALAWEPQWVTDLRAKADAYQKRLEEALARLRAAAQAAADKLAADAKARLAELIEILEGNLRAAKQMLAAQLHDYELVIEARLAAASAVAGELEKQVGEVIAGTRRQLDIDKRRLVTGTQQIVEASLHEAGVKLADTKIVDGALIARGVEHAETEAKRWIGVVVAGGGIIVFAFGAGLIWQRRRAGEAAARRWIVTAIGGVLIGAGMVAVVLGIRHWRRAPDGVTVALGTTRCDALEDAQRALDAGHAGAGRETTLAALERCQLLAADATTAELVADRTHRLRALAP